MIGIWPCGSRKPPARVTNMGAFDWRVKRPKRNRRKLNMSIGIALGTHLGNSTAGEATPQINITAAPVIAQSNTDPQGNATVSSSATSDDTGFAIVSSEWVHSVLGDVQSNTSPYTKPAGAAYTLRLKQVVSATGLPNKTVWSNILNVDALSVPAWNGLTDNPTYGDCAEIGSTLSVVTNGAVSAQRFGSAVDGTQFGTGANPSDFSSADGGTLHSRTTIDGIDYYLTADIRRAAPTVNAAASISGSAVEGGNLTGTEATFNGGGVTVTNLWEISDDGLTGWTSTGDTDTTSPTLVVDKYYRFTSTGTNSGGSAVSSSAASDQVSETDTTAPSMTSVTLGPQEASGDVPITFTGLDENCTAFWSLTTTDQSAATPAAVIAGGLTDEVDSGSFSATVGGGPYNDALPTGLSGNHYIQVALRDAALNVSTLVYSDGPVAIDTTAPVLVPASCTPADGATDIAIDSNITLIFDETVVAGTGNFYIYEGGVLSETIAVGSATIGTTDVVLNPVSDFTNNVDVSVRWDAGVVKDGKSNNVAANTTDTLLNFQSVASGPVLDTFTATNGTLLSAYTGESGKSWKNLHNDDAFIIQNNRLINNDIQPSYWGYDEADSNDMSVQADYYHGGSGNNSTTPRMGIGVRGSSDRNLYYLIYNPRFSGFYDFKIFKQVNGTETELLGMEEGTGSVPTLVIGNTYNIKLTVVGTTLTAYVDDVEIGSVTDSSLTAGVPCVFGYGISTAGTGPELDNFGAENLD